MQSEKLFRLVESYHYIPPLVKGGNNGSENMQLVMSSGKATRSGFKDSLSAKGPGINRDLKLRMNRLLRLFSDKLTSKFSKLAHAFKFLNNNKVRLLS